MHYLFQARQHYTLVLLLSKLRLIVIVTIVLLDLRQASGPLIAALLQDASRISFGLFLDPFDP